MTAVATSLKVRKANLVGPAVAALGAAALLIARFLPADMAVGLGLRLTFAAVCVLFVPGFLIVRLLGRPTEPALVLAAAFVWSLVAVFACLALTFAVDRSLVFTVGALVAVSLLCGSAGIVWNRPAQLPTRQEAVTVVAVLAAGLVVGAIVWWAAPPISGDALEHLARARKLAELPELESVRVSELFREGNLHPGYAFPLWHGVLALVARLAGVDTAEVIRILPALLAPVAFVVTYAAGAALFRSRWGGIAVLAGQAAVFALPLRGVPGLSVLETLSGPAHVALLVLVPGLLALVFTFADRCDGVLIASIAAAAFVLTVVHAPYTLFTALVLGGFALARVLLTPDARREAIRYGIAVSVVLVSAGLFMVWLLSAVTATAQVTPDATEKARLLVDYREQLDFFGDSFRFKPSVISAGGAGTVAGLLAVPLAFFARRTRWGAFTLGAAVPILAIILTPVFFTTFSDVASLSQARRLALFLPLGVAFAGGAVLVGRLRLLGVAAAAVLGITLQLAYPGFASFRHGPGGAEPTGGPDWPVWVAAIGAALALVAGVLRRRHPGGRLESSQWAAFAAVAFLMPVAALSVRDIDLRDYRPILSSGFVRALRTEVEPGEVVFGREEISYRVVAVAPVYVAASEADPLDRLTERIADVQRFYWPGTSDGERRRLLAKYDAAWLIVDERQPLPHEFLAPMVRAFEGSRYTLYRVP